MVKGVPQWGKGEESEKINMFRMICLACCCWFFSETVGWSRVGLHKLPVGMTLTWSKSWTFEIAKEIKVQTKHRFGNL